MNILVTGGAGFIGSNFIHYVLKQYPDLHVVNLDSLTYAGNLENLKDIQSNPRYEFSRGSISDRELVNRILSRGFDHVVNFAAESHVDRSIMDASPFIDTNIKGTQTLLEGMKQYPGGKYLQVSTDEVYGSINKGSFNEESNLEPNSPYSASKASADLLCRSYFVTFGVPVVITRCTNNFGPYQFPEKLIPLAITNALEGKEIPVYGDGMNVRDWIYTWDHCKAIDKAMRQGKPGEIYNIGSGVEKTNLDLLYTLLEILDKPRSLLKFVKDRPGHDRRYALDSSKIRNELKWKPECAFKEAMTLTVEWYLKNEPWWRSIKTGEYLKYYDTMYGKR
jgi:dTDP-glucose 4,6-dehydratase